MEYERKLKRTHVDTGRTCKFHRENPSKPVASCCDDSVSCYHCATHQFRLNMTKCDLTVTLKVLIFVRECLGVDIIVKLQIQKASNRTSFRQTKPSENTIKMQ